MLVSVDELRGYMSGISMTPQQRESAKSILEGIQSELERYINRNLEPLVVREVLPLDSSGFVTTSYAPVTEVLGLQVVMGEAPTLLSKTVLDPLAPVVGERPVYDLVPLDGGRDMIVPGGLRLNYSSWLNLDIQTSLSEQYRYVVVEYVAGATIVQAHLPAIRLSILRVAAREFQQMHDDTMSLRDTTAMNPTDPIPPVAKGWQEHELRSYDRLRRRVIV